MQATSLTSEFKCHPQDEMWLLFLNYHRSQSHAKCIEPNVCSAAAEILTYYEHGELDNAMYARHRKIWASEYMYGYELCMVRRWGKLSWTKWAYEPPEILQLWWHGFLVRQ